MGQAVAKSLSLLLPAHFSISQQRGASSGWFLLVRVLIVPLSGTELTDLSEETPIQLEGRMGLLDQRSGSVRPELPSSVGSRVVRHPITVLFTSPDVLHQFILLLPLRVLIWVSPGVYSCVS